MDVIVCSHLHQGANLDEMISMNESVTFWVYSTGPAQAVCVCGSSPTGANVSVQDTDLLFFFEQTSGVYPRRLGSSLPSLFPSSRYCLQSPAPSCLTPNHWMYISSSLARFTCTLIIKIWRIGLLWSFMVKMKWNLFRLYLKSNIISEI